MLILLEVIKSGILEKVIYVFLKMSFIHSYFLDFGKSETKRISYAASWGGEIIS